MEKIKKLFLLMAILLPAIAFTACGGDDEPDVPNQTLNVGQSYTIPADGTWTSDNDLIASVDGKTVKGVRVGEVAIRNGKQSFKVAVNPTITLYNDPYLEFGESPSAIKNFMSGYGYEYKESATSITYASQQNGVVVGYGYTLKDSKLTMTMVMAQRSIASTEKLGEYLAQRFVPVNYDDDSIGLISPDKKILVVFTMQVYSGNIMYVIAYAPNTSDTQGRSDNLDATFAKMIDAIPGELVKGGLK